MTGYQEILTDPSYAQQIITLTYPHIGNVGANTEDEESAQIFATGLVIRDLPVQVSNLAVKKLIYLHIYKNIMLFLLPISILVDSREFCEKRVRKMVRLWRVV